MAQPSNRTELIDYCKRQLGAPVLEINIADEQVEDLVDDAVQYFQERHFDGVYPALFKYKITQDDIDRGTSQPGKEGSVGITTETATQSFDGATQSFTWNENGNYLKVPDNIIGITKIFHYGLLILLSLLIVSSIKFFIDPEISVSSYLLFINDLTFSKGVSLCTYSRYESVPTSLLCAGTPEGIRETYSVKSLIQDLNIIPLSVTHIR